MFDKMIIKLFLLYVSAHIPSPPSAPAHPPTLAPAPHLIPTTTPYLTPAPALPPTPAPFPTPAFAPAPDLAASCF